MSSLYSVKTLVLLTVSILILLIGVTFMLVIPRRPVVYLEKSDGSRTVVDQSAINFNTLLDDFTLVGTALVPLGAFLFCIILIILVCRYSPSHRKEVDRPIVYTDGCCTKNGRRGARAGVGVYWGPEHSKNISDRLEGEQTNQRAEIMAAVKALETAKALGHKTLEIRTDSKYTINGATDWCLRWKKNGWKTINGTEVKNKTEFQTLTQLCDEIDVKWTHVPGHRGIPGNEAADSLARSGSLK